MPKGKKRKTRAQREAAAASAAGLAGSAPLSTQDFGGSNSFPLPNNQAAFSIQDQAFPDMPMWQSHLQNGFGFPPQNGMTAPWPDNNGQDISGMLPMPFMPMLPGMMPNLMPNMAPTFHQNGDSLSPNFMAPFAMQQQQQQQQQSIPQFPPQHHQQHQQPTQNKSQKPKPKPKPKTPRPSSPTAKKPARDAIVPPTPESGGVPDPTPPYLARASFSPQRSAGPPNHLLVVIDLNGTLLHRPNRASPSHFVARPHAQAFLAYCVRTFWVVIWSSARPANVRAMCDRLLSPADSRRAVAVWGRDRFGLTPDDYNRRVQCYKRLTRVWDDPDVARSHPDYAAGGRWTQGNTVLVDDSLEKARSEPHNLLQIPEFAGDVNEQPEILPQVHDYLNELCLQSDISMYIRKFPFSPGLDGWVPDTSD